MSESAHVENLVLGGGEAGTLLRDAILTQPTMAEGLNVLLAAGFT